MAYSFYASYFTIKSNFYFNINLFYYFNITTLRLFKSLAHYFIKKNDIVYYLFFYFFFENYQLVKTAIIKSKIK